MFNDIFCGSRNHEKECDLNANLVSQNAKKFDQNNGHFSVLNLKRSNPISENSPQEEWDNIAERMMLEFAESGHPVFRVTSPLSRGQLKSKGHGQLSRHCRADLDVIKTVFRTITS